MKIVLKALILLFILSCSNKQSSETKKNAIKIDTISYTYHGFNHHRKLELLSNKDFIRFESVASCFGDARIEKHFGKYELTDSTLTLNPEKVELTVYSSFPEEKDRKDTLQYGADSLKINTSFQIFEWKNKEYLLSEKYDSLRNYDFRNDYEKFAYYYNIGEEPNVSGKYLTRIKKDTTINIAWNINKIPKEYQNDFLKKPISVKIVDRKKIVEKDDYDPGSELVSWYIKIDKGKEDGIKKGFHFTTEDDEYFIDIDSVQSKVSFGKCYIYNMDEQYFRIGTEMRTKWKQ
ncbi:hypothetical protein [Aequorivita xiaoshiensis]|uniref:DUF3108 domain-containing protein n=1 Tax=Aequorivita xiaoshiensis TaxID=2874476 RepID=A0A9X1R4G7_9FLAO|nr:hypothetical protein [Aequorivita xiaoshiensis]MCG2432109.1 hypothetical protein [Aequorivita xiaoshiensis]